MSDAFGLDRRRFIAGSLALGASQLAGCGHRPQLNSYRLPAPGASGPASLRDHAANAGLLFGFAINTQALRESEPYRRLVREQCSILVAENAMKWGALRPGPTQFRFDEADMLVAFAEENKIKVRGHNLCWHEYLPTWFSLAATSVTARGLLMNHIRTVAGRYSGRMHSWDVVNEAIEVKDGRPDGLRNSPWLRLVGPEYIELAFRTAREADPMALLTYNDYGFEAETPEAAAKRTAILMLLRRLKQRNVPLDAMGVQSHLRAGGVYGPGLQQFLTACRELGLQIFLTELDVDDRALPADVELRDPGVARQYGSYLNAALQSREVTAVLTWGVDDGHTWLNTGDHARTDRQPQRPLLFDSNFVPTPAWAAVRDAFDARQVDLSKPTTRQVLPLPRLR